MAEPAAVFRATYADYLEKLGGLDMDLAASTLGVRVRDRVARVPYFKRLYTVSPDGIRDETGKRPDYGTCVVLCKYLLMSPAVPSLRKDWVTYKDFKDAAPLVHSFASTVHRPIAERFSGRLGDLRSAAAAIGGRPIHVDVSCDLALRFDPLTRLPMFLLFNDSDDEFPASATVLFEERAGEFLDMECLAIAGMHLAGHLCRRRPA